MTAAQPASRVLSTAFGLLMAAAAAVLAQGPALVLAALAMIAVLAGIWLRPSATLAVLLVVAALVLSDPSPIFAALSGLTAAAYLVLRHAVGLPPGIVTATEPSVVGAVGFTALGLMATSVPLQLPWLPLAAPLAVFGIYALSTHPFAAKREP